MAPFASNGFHQKWLLAQIPSAASCVHFLASRASAPINIANYLPSFFPLSLRARLRPIPPPPFPSPTSRRRLRPTPPPPPHRPAPQPPHHGRRRPPWRRGRRSTSSPVGLTGALPRATRCHMTALHPSTAEAGRPSTSGPVRVGLSDRPCVLCGSARQLGLAAARRLFLSVAQAAHLSGRIW